MELNLNYVPLDLRDDKGNFIGHLDFEAVTDLSLLVQMLENAVINMRGHANSQTHPPNGLYNQVRAFAERIEGGFEHAQGILGEKYYETKLPQLYASFNELRKNHPSFIEKYIMTQDRSA